MLGIAAQPADAASSLIGKRETDLHGTILYLDPEEGLNYAMEHKVFLKHYYSDHRPTIAYAMDSVEPDPKPKPGQPVVHAIWFGKSSENDEKQNCFESFTRALGRLISTAAEANNVPEGQSFYLADVITEDINKIPSPAGVIRCEISDGNSVTMGLRGQIKNK